jgi:translation initiation factor 3 subunit E
LSNYMPFSDLSARLNLSPSEGEKWIVNLIRDARTSTGGAPSTLSGDAKIDLEQNVITTSKPALPIYQTVIEKTRGLAFRTQVLGAAMANRAVGDAEGQQSQEGGGKGRRREREDKTSATVSVGA